MKKAKEREEKRKQKEGKGAGRNSVDREDVAKWEPVPNQEGTVQPNVKKKVLPVEPQAPRRGGKGKETPQKQENRQW